MFFLIQRRDTISLPPRYFTRNLEIELMSQLRNKIEGKCSGRYGYTLAITNLEDISSGKLHDDTGYAEYNILYNCLVFRPFKNEIIPAIVKSITPNGLFVEAGPMNIFISEKLMPDDLVYDSTSIQPSYVSNDINENIKIEIGRYIRVKIVGIRLAADDIVVIGTIKEDFLG